MNKQKTALVLGAGGFIGNHLVNHLKSEGYWVRGVDLKYPEFQEKSNADQFKIADLSLGNAHIFKYNIYDKGYITRTEYFDEVYQLAADMGGAGYIFSGENDANVMTNSALINLLCCRSLMYSKSKVFYSSSACIYPEHNQLDPNNPNCEESSAYPADPDSEYGFEKLFSERLYLAYNRNYGLDVRIARFHNIFGPCFDDKTEVLTDTGWKLFENLDKADKIASLDSTNTCIFQEWVDRQKYYYEGDMYAAKDRGVDQLVTPDHKVYVSTKTTKTKNKKQKTINTPFSLRTVKDLKWDSSSMYFTSKFNWTGLSLKSEFIFKATDMSDGRTLHPIKIVAMDDWFEFMGWYISEGSMFKTPTNYTVCITQHEKTNSKNRKSIKDLLNRMNINFSEDKKQTQIFISNKQIFQTLLDEGMTPGCLNKHIPQWMLSYEQSQLRILYDTLMKGDGNKTGRRYNTTSKKLADNFQELALKLGYSASIKKECTKNIKHSDMYRIHICTRSQFDTGRNSRSMIQYAGYVYDVTLPEHHVLLVRRNGKAVWSGNCGTWKGGKEKAPAAICRKVLEADNEIEIWGDGEQTRSFLYIDECIKGIRKLMESDFLGPVNIGSEEQVTINQLVDIACSFDNKQLIKKHIKGPLGVRGRNSDNKLIQEKLGWAPNYPLKKGLEQTYNWIKSQINNK